jgi:hypothetical protein
MCKINIYNKDVRMVCKLKKVCFREEEVIAFLEDRIKDGISSEVEDTLYEDFHWQGRLIKDRRYKKVLRTMEKEYMGGY